LKKIFIFFFILLILNFSIFAQRTLVQSSDSSEQGETVVEILDLENNISKKDWLGLVAFTGNEYFDRFSNLLETSCNIQDLQPYVLAECLWYSIFSGDNSVATSEKNDINILVQKYLNDIDSGLIAKDDKSDVAYFLLKYLGTVINKTEVFPNLKLFLSEDFLLLPNDEKLSTVLFKNVIRSKNLKDLYSKIDSVESVYEIPAYCYESDFLFFMANSKENLQIYNFLKNKIDIKETSQEHCLKLLKQLEDFSVLYKFNSSDILSPFMNTIVEYIVKQPFGIFCLEENIFSNFYSDLILLNELIPVYFERFLSINQNQSNEF